MGDLKIDGTSSTPTILCNGEAGVLEMRGDSYPENSFEFFTPVLAWVEDFICHSDKPFTANLHLLYLNTSSVKAMMDIFDMLEEAHRQGRQVSVNWFYDEENERVADLAEEFKEDCTFPFVITPNVA
ncbi:biofilm regulation phosphoprotein SiaC [Methylogaea oryzae]|uniref:SiaC family regulatory phosphoprotein domain-containing protein n=1 Tax=Methylogaea oryzae TaxID=1295382 RepID=A0A8D4VR83_9GAMM|nr:biofilm regulation phosphoprotein SiaC [Methylogaea oryzae]BBL71104.1 hypothetical protein MoryE10_17100 [Methylogaea oryzae]